MENKERNRIELLPVSGVLLLPGTDVAFRMGSLKPEQMQRFQETGQTFAAALVKGEKEFYTKGALFTVNSVTNSESGTMLMAHILKRVQFLEIEGEEAFTADYEELPEDEDLDERSREEMLQYMKKAVDEIAQSIPGGQQFSQEISAYSSLNTLMVYLSQFMPLSREERYRLFETDSLRERSLLFIDYLLRHRELIKLNLQMREKFSERANKHYREQALREQLRAIQEELHEDEGDAGEGKADYRTRIEQSGMPDEARKAALEEVRKLETAGHEGTEQNMIRNYLDFMLELPWQPEKAAAVDLKRAREILEEGHYGLKKVKERIIQHLAVMKLKDENKGSALLLVGPPGTGKTSLGKSIAEALGRKYIRMSLGGVRDEAEIRGHRRTYVVAMPGRILQSIRRAGTMNPVLVLDEIDKLTPGGFSGDPASALLETLDPEQNHTFTDHYLDLPYDLSHVFFIATANSLDGIPAPLLDRMEVIEVSGYTPDEKFHIGKSHLLAEVLESCGIPEGKLTIDDEILRKIIADYTREAGVRGLKKQLEALARAATEKIVSGQEGETFAVREEDLEESLGHKVSRHEMAQKENPPGVVTGLAWTPVGGEILFIETMDMPGSGEVILTGQLGDVMKESARISLSLLKSRLPFNTVNFKERDLHIHVPSGAVPKDGPSAGIALFTALASLVTGKKVDAHLAMTGEITLRGEVTPIGGLKEKLYGAQRAGIQRVLIPKENLQDLKEVPEEIKAQLTIIPVANVEEVLHEALDIALPRVEHILYSLAEAPKMVGPGLTV